MRVLIADEHALFRDGLGLVVEQLDDDATIIQASNFSQSIKLLETEPKFDLVMVDLQMHDMDWEQAFAEICRRCCDAKVVAISANDNVHDIKESLRKGANGFISKCSEAQILKSALQLVLNGGIYVPPVVLDNDNDRTADAGRHMTKRQKEVLSLLAKGMSNKQIAETMGISEATVKLHINAVLKFLEVKNRTQALLAAQKKGLI